MRNQPLHKIQKLTKLLILSGTINILMFAFLGYWYIKERPPVPVCERKPKFSEIAVRSEAINDRINTLFPLSFDRLIQQLNDKTSLESGYLARDLALGCMICFHDFDPSRVLPENLTQTRQRFFVYTDSQKQKQKIPVFSGLNDHDFDRIIEFVKIEKWPFTSKGLFHKLKIPEYKESNNLKYAFYITPEFMSVELLFKRAGLQSDKEDLLRLLLEGNWEMLASFAAKQRIDQDLSEEERRSFLLRYIEIGSATAAAFFLKTDSKYAVKKLDDEHVVDILRLSRERTPYAARFALEALASPRNDSVWKEATERLYEFVGEKNPGLMGKDYAVSRFLSGQQSPPDPISTGLVKKWRRAYTVTEGDSLWKISRMFKVNVPELKKQNNMDTDILKPGTMILVP